MKAIVVVLGFLFLVGIALLLLALVGLLAYLLALIGLVVFVGLLAALVIGGLVLIVSVPYYFVTKRAEVTPGAYTLEQAKER